jgi:hypothetical protein
LRATRRGRLASNEKGPPCEGEIRIRETDMYPPLREYLVKQGYTVRSEVRGCDVVAEKDGDVIVLEMKRSLSVALLAQAAERQRAIRSVYVVVPHPGKRLKSKEWRAACRLLKRLELGLVLVRTEPPGRGEQAEQVEVIQHPIPFQRVSLNRERIAILREVRGRSGDFNQGGSTGRRLVTAYRENAIMIACFLSILGPSTPADLRSRGTGPKTLSILSSNFYGWFRRVSRGVYELAPKGLAEARSYEQLWQKYTEAARLGAK